MPKPEGLIQETRPYTINHRCAHLCCKRTPSCARWSEPTRRRWFASANFPRSLPRRTSAFESCTSGFRRNYFSTPIHTVFTPCLHTVSAPFVHTGCTPDAPSLRPTVRGVGGGVRTHLQAARAIAGAYSHSHRIHPESTPVSTPYSHRIHTRLSQVGAAALSDALLQKEPSLSEPPDTVFTRYSHTTHAILTPSPHSTLKGWRGRIV